MRYPSVPGRSGPMDLQHRVIRFLWPHGRVEVRRRRVWNPLMPLKHVMRGPTDLSPGCAWLGSSYSRYAFGPTIGNVLSAWCGTLVLLKVAIHHDDSVAGAVITACGNRDLMAPLLPPLPS